MTADAIALVLTSPMAQELLHSPLLTRLGYVGLDGYPRVIPIGYVWDGSAFADDVRPLIGPIEALDQLSEGGLVLWRELKPREEVEGLVSAPPMMQPTRDSRQVLHANCDVVRALLKDCALLLLGEPPPGLGFRDRDERRPSRGRKTEGRLPTDEDLMLLVGRESLPARDAPEHPGRVGRHQPTGFNNGDPRSVWKRRPGHGGDAGHGPRSFVALHEACE
jgi:hypothetical protein